MEIQGKIKVIGETQTFGSKGFRKRELVITTDEQYPQYIMVEFIQDKTNILDKYKVGENVKIGINLRGREWINPEGVAKYFNTIQGWQIAKTLNDIEVSSEVVSDKIETDNNENDDLPW